MVKIRLARVGRLNKPLYTILATDSRKPRNNGFLAQLGQYDPRGKEPLKGINVDAIKGYVKNGAHVTDTIRTIFKKNNVQL